MYTEGVLSIHADIIPATFQKYPKIDSPSTPSTPGSQTWEAHAIACRAVFCDSIHPMGWHPLGDFLDVSWNPSSPLPHTKLVLMCGLMEASGYLFFPHFSAPRG